jgi:hypothetical protein
MRYDQMAEGGNGVFVIQWDDTTPVGDNASVSPTNTVLQIWGDGSGVRLFTSVRGPREQVPAAIADQAAFHEYAVVFEAGAYRFLLDDQVIFGPIQSTLRPSAIWMGNPILSWVGPCSGWSAFSVDSNRVEADAATPASRSTMGSLKALYRSERKPQGVTPSTNR